MPTKFLYAPSLAPPQGEDGEVRWILFVLGFYFMGLMGVIGMCLSLAWIIHICIYMLPVSGPISPFLNLLFIALGNAWVFLGVIFFGLFCLYLMSEWSLVSRRTQGSRTP